MAECEVEWLSQEVIQELLEIELEPEPSTPGPAANTKSDLVRGDRAILADTSLCSWYR